MGSRQQHQPVLAWGRLGGAEAAVGGAQEGAELDSCVQEWEKSCQTSVLRRLPCRGIAAARPADILGESVYK